MPEFTDPPEQAIPQESPQEGDGEILIDLPRELIIAAVDTFAQHNMSKVSYSIVKQALEMDQDYEVPLSHIFERLGRAVFNEILVTAIKQKMAEEADDNPA